MSLLGLNLEKAAVSNRLYHQGRKIARIMLYLEILYLQG